MMTIRLICATALACGVVQAGSAAQSAELQQDGRFEGVSASDTTVWVVDTRTGRVRKCTQEFADQAPVCTALSN